MRLIKMCGLAAVVTAAMAITGAAPAAAETTALCKVLENQCKTEAQLINEAYATPVENQYRSIHLILTSGNVWELSSPGFIVLCLNALLAAKVEALGAPQELVATALTFSACGTTAAHNNCKVTTEELPTYKLLKTGANVGEAEPTKGIIEVWCTVGGMVVMDCAYELNPFAGVIPFAGRNGANGHGMFEEGGFVLSALGGSFCPEFTEISKGLLEPLTDVWITA